MKKSFFIIICASVFISHANAKVYRCITKPSSGNALSCSAEPSDSTAEWKLNCSFQNAEGTQKTFEAKGLGLCGVDYGNGNESIYAYASSSSNKCYCRMFYPYGGSGGWILATTYSDYSSCVNNCAYSCSMKISTDASFREDVLISG